MYVRDSAYSWCDIYVDNMHVFDEPGNGDGKYYTGKFSVPAGGHLWLTCQRNAKCTMIYMTGD